MTSPIQAARLYRPIVLSAAARRASPLDARRVAAIAVQVAAGRPDPSRTKVTPR